MTLNDIVEIDGHRFHTHLVHFRFPTYHQIEDTRELAKLKCFPLLESANFSDTNLDDVGLEIVCSMRGLVQLDLQSTRVSNSGIRSLLRLPNLAHLRLKENSQLDDACMKHVEKLACLQELQIHETSISLAGLLRLQKHREIREIIIELSDGNFPFVGLRAFSKCMPECTILVKSVGEFLAGEFAGTWPNM